MDNEGVWKWQSSGVKKAIELALQHEMNTVKYSKIISLSLFYL